MTVNGVGGLFDKPENKLLSGDLVEFASAELLSKLFPGVAKILQCSWANIIVFLLHQ